MAGMVTNTKMNVAPPVAAETDTSDLYLTPEDGRREFESAAQAWMGMSGEEFIRRWEVGEYWGVADDEGYRHIGDLIMMIPLARQDS